MSGLKLAPAVAELDPRRQGACRGPDDPLVNAVIWKLPDTGQPFPAGARNKWLSMMALAFDVAYGEVDEPLSIPEVRAASAPAPSAAAPPAAPAKPKRDPHAAAGCDFYVDHQGYARSDFEKQAGIPMPTPARRILPDELDVDDQLYDYRGAARDRNTIIWADDQVGVQGLSISLCGPG